MTLYSPKQVIDLDEFLPVDGEDRVTILYDGSTLRLEIFYEAADANEESKKVIEFIQADYFVKSLFPGYSLVQSQQEMDISLLHSLVEYEESDWISKIYDPLGGEEIKHYRILLHSVGMALDVACKSWAMY